MRNKIIKKQEKETESHFKLYYAINLFSYVNVIFSNSRIFHKFPKCFDYFETCYNLVIFRLFWHFHKFDLLVIDFYESISHTLSSYHYRIISCYDSNTLNDPLASVFASDLWMQAYIEEEQFYLPLYTSVKFICRNHRKKIDLQDLPSCISSNHDKS